MPAVVTAPNSLSPTVPSTPTYLDYRLGEKSSILGNFMVVVMIKNCQQKEDLEPKYKP